MSTSGCRYNALKMSTTNHKIYFKSTMQWSNLGKQLENSTTEHHQKLNQIVVPINIRKINCNLVDVYNRNVDRIVIESVGLIVWMPRRVTGVFAENCSIAIKGWLVDVTWIQLNKIAKFSRQKIIFFPMIHSLTFIVHITGITFVAASWNVLFNHIDNGKKCIPEG